MPEPDLKFNIEEFNYSLYMRFYLIPKTDAISENVELFSTNICVYKMYLKCNSVEHAVKEGKRLVEEFKSRFKDDPYFDLCITVIKMVNHEYKFGILMVSNEVWKEEKEPVSIQESINGFGFGPIATSGG